MPELETERLAVRGFRPEDWRDLQEYVAQEQVTRYDFEYPSSDADCQGIVDYFGRSEGYWAVCLRETGKMIGHLVCTRKAPDALRTWQLGFIFNPAYYGQGYATEACRRVLAYVFGELGAHRVEAACHPDNAPSWRLMERLGMRREAHHRKDGFLRQTPAGKPIWSDSYVYAILEEEWAG